MRRADFHFDLPPALIAQRPLPERSASRLLTLDGPSGALADRTFQELPALLRPGDLLVFNNTRVIPARLFGHKASGGQVEILIERLLDAGHALALIRASKAPRAGTLILLPDGAALEVLGREDDLFRLRAVTGTLTALLARHGHVPLPPYIERADDAADQSRYQTVYASRDGAVAAPTAGLHFDAPLLARLAALGIESAQVTLHVGAGTFQPVRVDDLAAHRMHAEWLEVDAAVCAAVARTRARGGRVVAVGTTSVRSLEGAFAAGLETAQAEEPTAGPAAAGEGCALRPYQGDTRLFIRPGFQFQVVDAMITNFHLPESTLLMLVCAFAGYDQVMAAYRHAVAERYRFFSYGDAMFLTRRPVAPVVTADAR